MKLIVDWIDFERNIKNFIEEGNLFESANNRNPSTEEYEKLKKEYALWTNKVVEYLDSSFDVSPNEYSFEFKHAKKQRFNLPNVRQETKSLSQLMIELKEDIRSKLNSLMYTFRILGVSDVIIGKQSTDLVDRNSYTTEQTLNLILDKLYELYDNSNYSVVDIMKGNGIELKRSHEDRELGALLADSGYVELNHRNDTYAMLTLNGKMFVEEKRITFVENYDDISLDKAEMDARIDEIIDRLNKLGLGQEIIFEELEDLRETYIKLSKKSWAQLVKGKLVDLALAKLIENDTLQYLYKELTSHDLRLW